MFGWAGGLGASVAVDVDKERNPPAPPTPLDFPRYDPPASTATDPVGNFDTLYRKFRFIKRPQDITVDHLNALNLRVVFDVPASKIVPEQYLKDIPPLVWEVPESEEEVTPVIMSNGYAYPTKDKWDIAKTELLLDNDEAFQEVARMQPKPGRQRIKVTQSRKFWAGLERMAQYWDTSLDHYYEKPVQPEESTNGDSATDAMQTDKDQDVNRATMQDDGKMDIDSPKNSQNSGNPQVKTFYTGRRLGAGHEMPEDIREDTLRGLIELAAWPFGCQAIIPSLPPRVAVRNILLPVRQTLVAGRCPLDRQLARKGVIEGPMVIVSCRPETSFRDPDEAPGSGQREMCDLLREVGGMLLAAQERSRHGVVEIKPGEGKWWTTKPRWGGAPNEDTPAQSENSDSKPEEETGNVHKRSRYANPMLPSRRFGSSHPRKLSTSERWKILQAGPSLWDKKLRYTQIGKPKDSPFDDIYMLSSVNHHVSLVHLRVHRRYVDYITRGKSDLSEESDSSGQPWHALSLRRTRWYDLMKAEDRLEALEGTWIMFHYLMKKSLD